MKKFKTIDLRSIDGIQQAERLKRLGWNIISVGFTTIILEQGVKGLEVDHHDHLHIVKEG